jgi:nucleoside-diphosphate-sugar epimerase
MQRKILVTGAAGYIGSVLVRQLLNKGYFVNALDSLNFNGESLLGIYNNPHFKFFRGDVRDKNDVLKSLEGVWGIIHLAAIVGDPACAKQPELAEETNWKASKLLFDLANENGGIKRFIFASTCSNYGKMQGAGYVNEDSPLAPVSLYAELKVKFENYLLKAPIRNDFFPTALRFSTVYGLSPRMRFDLTVNEFIRDAHFQKELVIYGEQFWRPYCHVDDLAAACLLVLESDDNKVGKQVFNVGDTHENYQKKMIAEAILKLLPETTIKYIAREEDPRDYRVEFTKINKLLGYRISKTMPHGLQEILSAIEQGIISDPYSEVYKNI